MTGSAPPDQILWPRIIASPAITNITPTRYSSGGAVNERCHHLYGRSLVCEHG